MSCIFFCLANAASKALSISLPVTSLWCKILNSLWPPSLPNLKSPSGALSNCAPQSIISLILSTPSLTTISTICLSHKPSPAIKVSSICFAKLSLSKSITPAMPPCAYLVLVSSLCVLVSTVIFLSGHSCATFNA